VNVNQSTCSLPGYTLAYLFNATVVPRGPLVYLTLWPECLAKPNVSTPNADDAAITSTMAILINEDDSVFVCAGGTTNIILDISSYFAQ
jgi:hypothetical protein